MKFSLVVLTFLAVAAAQEEEPTEEMATEDAEETEVMEVIVPVKSAAQSMEVISGAGGKIAVLSWYTYNVGTNEAPEEYIYFECTGTEVSRDTRALGFNCGATINDGTTLDGCNVNLKLTKKGKYEAYEAIASDWFGAPTQEEGSEETTYPVTMDAGNNDCEVVEEEGWNTIIADDSAKNFIAKMKWRKLINTTDSEDMVIAVKGQVAAEAMLDEEQVKYSIHATFGHEPSSTHTSILADQVFLSGAMQVAASTVAAVLVAASLF